MGIYSNGFDGTYTMYPDFAFPVDVSSTDHSFSQAATIYCGGAGNVVATPFAGGSNVTVAVVAGGVVPFRVSKVVKASTTATSMIAVY